MGSVALARSREDPVLPSVQEPVSMAKKPVRVQTEVARRSRWSTEVVDWRAARQRIVQPTDTVHWAHTGLFRSLSPCVTIFKSEFLPSLGKLEDVAVLNCIPT